MQIHTANRHCKKTMYLRHGCLIIISCRESNKLSKESLEEQTQKSFWVSAESLDCIKCDRLGCSAECMQCKSSSILLHSQVWLCSVWPWLQAMANIWQHARVPPLRSDSDGWEPGEWHSHIQPSQSLTVLLIHTLLRAEHLSSLTASLFSASTKNTDELSFVCSRDSTHGCYRPPRHTAPHLNRQEWLDMLKSSFIVL